VKLTPIKVNPPSKQRQLPLHQEPAAGARYCRGALARWAGGSLRTSTRPTLNRRTESPRMNAHSRKTRSDLGRVLVFNDPPACVSVHEVVSGVVERWKRGPLRKRRFLCLLGRVVQVNPSLTHN